MKKLLIFMLVLCMASSANAVLQISVGGVQEPIDSEIWLLPSEYLTLDVWTTTDITPGVGEGYFALVCSTADATISGGVNVSAEPSLYVYQYFGDPGGIWVAVALATAPSLPAGSTLTDLIDFHCEWQPNDVLVELIFDIGYPIYGTAAVVDSVIIHQIPEPMTVLLLGLGGLFLRRRR